MTSSRVLSLMEKRTFSAQREQRVPIRASVSLSMPDEDELPLSTSTVRERMANGRDCWFRNIHNQKRRNRRKPRTKNNRLARISK